MYIPNRNSTSYLRRNYSIHTQGSKRGRSVSQLRRVYCALLRSNHVVTMLVVLLLIFATNHSFGYQISISASLLPFKFPFARLTALVTPYSSSYVDQKHHLLVNGSICRIRDLNNQSGVLLISQKYHLPVSSIAYRPAVSSR